MNFINTLFPVILFCCLNASSCFGGIFPTSYVNYCVRLEIGDGGGSGFLLEASNSVYIVTARHVFFNWPGPTNDIVRGPEIKCVSVSNTNIPIVLNINLGELLASGNLRHSSNHDVALAKIGYNSPALGHALFTKGVHQQDEYSLNSMAINTADSCSKSSDVEVGAEIFVVGFPISLGLKEMPQIDFETPLLRRGIVAGKNKSKNLIIIDCPSYHGNSGGPVLSKTDLSMTTYRVDIIGIVTQYVPYREIWVNQNEQYANQQLSNSGYSVVEPMDAVLQMFW